MVVGEFAQKRQLIIIGGGPGGYNAAIRAAQLGMEVTLIEKEKLGGVCLNKGCIPSKVLTYAASQYKGVHQLNGMGIETRGAVFHPEKFREYQTTIVSNLQKGVEALCKANKIEIVAGTASFMSENRIGVDSGHHFEMYEYEHAMIATGAHPVLPEGIEKAGDRILSGYDLVNLDVVPEHFIVYGSDYIALETATAYRNLGSNVTLIMKEETFAFDSTITKELLRVLKKAKIKVLKSSKLIETVSDDEKVAVTVQSESGEKATIEGSHLFISFEYKSNTKDLGLEMVNIDLDEKGSILVNDVSQTNVENIYAVGDCTIGPKLASRAIKQGKTAAEHIAGIKSSYNLSFVPMIVHTTPPIATVGLTEEEAREQGYKVRTGQFAISGNGYAAILGQKEGVAKMIVDKETDLLLGVHMMGAGAVEMIHAGTLALEMVAREEDVSYPIFAHPSLNESWLEAIENVTGKAIHIAPPKKKETSNV
ncbi:dihydrolipoyl dehydrogenase [Fictibacillus gelatini]|uniref:dihydrolipoyl dehydrogenase n=1 Tax=Fictibacillus gelatini TaxID=225985 RepID=UPI000426D732|nr:dihydrolipoyl dehydrogenase [Fictibacillus gelatini]